MVSDLDLIRGAQDGDLDSDTARTVATTPVRSIELTAPLTDAVDVMTAEGLSHLIVVEPHAGRPVGVMSTLEVAHVLAGLSHGDGIGVAP